MEIKTKDVAGVENVSEDMKKAALARKKAFAKKKTIQSEESCCKSGGTCYNQG